MPSPKEPKEISYACSCLSQAAGDCRRFAALRALGSSAATFRASCPLACLLLLSSATVLAGSISSEAPSLQAGVGVIEIASLEISSDARQLS